MDEAHRSKYYVHPCVNKMYYDLRDRYWWPRMKKDIVEYVSKCLTCLKVKAEHQRPSGLLQQPEILSAHFIPMHDDYKMERLARLYLNEIVARHGVPISIILDHDSRFTLRFWKSMQEALVTRLDMSTAYHPQTDGQSERTIQTLEYMLRALRLEKKSYADKRRKPLEFSVGDYVLLKVSPWKGVVRFGKKGKLAPRFVGPFEIVKKVGPVAYQLDLPEELNDVHDTFHVSNLKKCLADPTLQVPLDEIRVDAKLNFVEEPVEILEREFKKLKRSRIAIVKVRWNSKRGPEFTWEREDQMKLKYPLLFSDIWYRVDGDDFCENYEELRFIVINNPFWKVNKARVIMSSVTSVVTYTSVYTDSEPDRAFWGADDEEVSEGGIPRVILLGYDGLPIQPVAPPSPDYIPGPEDPQTPPVPHDEDEREPMFVQAHDHDYVPEPIYPEYITLEDDHEFLAKEQPLAKKDPEEYEDDETEDGPVDYPMDGGDDGDDDDDDSSGDDARDEDEDEEDDEEEEEEEEHLLMGLVASTQALIDAVTAALPSPPLPPSLYIPPPVDRRDDIPESEQPPRKRLYLSTIGSRYEIGESSTARPTRGRGIDYGFVSTVDAEERRQGIRDVGYGIRDTWVDPAEAVPEISPMTVGEDSRSRISQRADMDSQRVDLLMGDRMTLQETVWIVEEEAHASREAWAHSIELSTPDTDTAAEYSHSDTTSDMRREMSDMQAELLALREQQRRARQPGPEARFQITLKLASGTQTGVVGLTRWIEKMESVFNISGCAIENQVKFATCTLLGAALTWWNGQIRTLGPEAYAMTWEVLKKKVTDKYCPQGEIKKLEIEL
ncbi:reverse transcriptase domain-containing protein [Tanacetum coccineum]